MGRCAVDDSTAFWRLVRSEYPNWDSFKQDFREFQKATCTSFYIYNSVTHAGANKQDAQFSVNFPYKYVTFCCVHRRRKGNRSSRYPNLECGAFITLHYVDTGYGIARCSLKHSHSFQVGREGFYVRNRRLTHDEEKRVFSLMDAFNNTSELREFTDRHFHRRLLSHDFLSIRNRHSKMASVNEGDRIANAECVVKDLVNALTMLGEADYQYWHNQLSVLSGVLRIRPDVKLMYQLPGFASPVAVESSEDISKVTASSKLPAAMWQPVASTSQKCPADIGRGNSILTECDIAVENVGAPSKHSQSIAFRKLRSQTAGQFKTESKRRKLEVPSSPIRQDVCIVCRKIDPDVNLDENTEWVQCDRCDRWSHKHCAANYNHPWYYCVHCIAQ